MDWAERAEEETAFETRRRERVIAPATLGVGASGTCGCKRDTREARVPRDVSSV